MNIDKPIISKVEILGLHGDRNVVSNFNSPVKILVDENGSGKTTFLNILAGLLQREWNLVSRYEFSEIIVHFTDNKVIKYERSELNDEWVGFASLKHLANFSSNRMEHLLHLARDFSYSELTSTGMLESFAKELNVHPKVLYSALIKNDRSLIRRTSTITPKQLSIDLDNPANIIKSKILELQELFPYRVLYFPTYRIVEESLNYLVHGKKAQEPYRHYIQFGMDAVKKQWTSITNNIRRSALQSFSAINGRMLDELAEGIHTESIDYASFEQPKALEIVLARSGENISKKSRARILDLVTSGRIKEAEYAPLAYFLSNLIKIYEQQKTTDNAIKSFVQVANQYLTDKKIHYDEAEMAIEVINTHSEKPIQLDKLSSGEKQIVSIFTKLYLEINNPEPYAIFFDEPELSLSIEWQKKLLQDIANSDQCIFLLAATHSPFIFENNLAKFADVLTIEFLEKSDEQA